MFGRPIFFEPAIGQRDQSRSNEFLRFPPNQAHGIPLTALSPLRNDGVMLDLNLIFVEDTDRARRSNVYLAPNLRYLRTGHMLDYIRQMEERYLAMERELTRRKMVIPVIRRTTSRHRTSQTDVNWKECSLAKYGYVFGAPGADQCRKSQEHVNAAPRRRYAAKRAKDFAQTSQNDIHPLNEAWNRGCQLETTSSNCNAVCSMHNVAAIVPQDSGRLSDFLAQSPLDSNTSSGIRESASEYESGNGTLDGSGKSFSTPGTQQASMEVCQGSDKKHEPETAYHADFDVKHEDRAQTKPVADANTPECRRIIGPKFCDDMSDGKPRRSRESRRTKFYENADSRRKEGSLSGQASQSNRNNYHDHGKKATNERTRCTNDTRNVSRMLPKQKKETHRRVPTPRSNVHTAYAPMVQPSSWNPALDPNGFTIQLLRLAVLLYAPALMPALNLLIARQNTQTIPMPCSEGTNDLLTQIFRILSNQQSVPNLPYVHDEPVNEGSPARRSNSPDACGNPLAENPATRLAKPAANIRPDSNSIGVNTSLEICCCSGKRSPSARNCVSHDRVEGSEKLVYSWMSEKSSEATTRCEGKRDDSRKKQGGENFLIDRLSGVWDQARLDDAWNF